MADNIGTLSVGILADTSQFNANIASAQKAIQGFKGQIEQVSVVGNALKSRLIPIAASLTAAFGAKVSLEAYGLSTLPGAKEFKSSVEASQKSLKKLSEAVGEYLAPAAAFVAKTISKIADALVPIIRAFTALTQSSAEFLKKLASNFAAAFAPVIPTVAAAVEYLNGLFSGPAHDWAKDIEAFRQKWNETWDSILFYAAPILVELGNIVEASLVAIREIATDVFGVLKSLVGDVADWIGSKLPESVGAAGSAFEGLGDKIWIGAVAALSTVEFAIKNWRQVAEISFVAVEYAGLKAFNTIAHYGSEAWDNLKSLASQMVPIFESLGENIGEIFRAAFQSVVGNFVVLVNRLKELGSRVKDYLTGNFTPLEWRNLVNPANLLHAGGEFTAPDFSGVKPLPGVTLPGFRERTPTPDENFLRGLLGSLTANFGSGLKEFLKTPLGDLEAFVATIKKNLPNVTAKPGSPIAKATEVSSAIAGTFNPNAVRGLGANSFAKRTADAAEQVAKNTKNLPGLAFPGMGI